MLYTAREINKEIIMKSVLGSDIRNRGVQKNKVKRWMKLHRITVTGVIAVAVVIIAFCAIGVVEAHADYVDTDSSQQTETTTNSDGSTETCVTSCVTGGGCYTNCF
jgi:hypothetical protein